MKPGYKTTEFWTTLLISGAAITNLFHPMDIDNAALTQVAGIFASVAMGIAYVTGRAKVKTAGGKK